MKNTVSQLMTREVIQVAPETLLFECVEMMAQHCISSVLISKKGKPLGLLTERDVMRLLSRMCRKIKLYPV